jgi:hypothetical protein
MTTQKSRCLKSYLLNEGLCGNCCLLEGPCKTFSWCVQKPNSFFVEEFLGVILKVFRLEVFIYNVYITNQFQTTIPHGVGGVKCVNRGDCE